MEAGTLIQSSEIDSESGTAIFPIKSLASLPQTENIGTKLISEQIETDKSFSETASTSELTRVGRSTRNAALYVA